MSHGISLGVRHQSRRQLPFYDRAPVRASHAKAGFVRRIFVCGASSLVSLSLSVGCNSFVDSADQQQLRPAPVSMPVTSTPTWRPWPGKVDSGERATKSPLLSSQPSDNQTAYDTAASAKAPDPDHARTDKADARVAIEPVTSAPQQREANE